MGEKKKLFKLLFNAHALEKYLKGSSFRGTNTNLCWFILGPWPLAWWVPYPTHPLSYFWMLLIRQEASELIQQSKGYWNIVEKYCMAENAIHQLPCARYGHGLYVWVFQASYEDLLMPSIGQSTLPIQRKWCNAVCRVESTNAIGKTRWPTSNLGCLTLRTGMLGGGCLARSAAGIKNLLREGPLTSCPVITGRRISGTTYLFYYSCYIPPSLYTWVRLKVAYTGRLTKIPLPNWNKLQIILCLAK